ncbi:oligosaccharide repeat unit polymerase [Deinococcus psychrotolerans]|uniref:Oligosaccharide repeat unit polymerase n=1 Tax=Deinococcus psychrotolerans TaxID=2489213 RepID=A0A3G8YLS1_9DEIO|nr:oligosaccharide repeat unit polymerase [Deinococcus psychrotolerans]AZI42076.1 oligosaccharide repeat unit polymerase [Deinococcus psychrotolerans]
MRDNIINSVASGKIGWTSDMSLALTVSIWWIACQVDENYRKKTLFIAIVNVILFSFMSLLSLSRDTLLTAILILLIIQLSNYKIHNLRSRLRVLLAILSGIVLFTIVFVFIGNSRASGGNDTYLSQFIGYFPSSYNRLAALIEGKLQFPSSGIGYYSTQGLWDFPVLSNIFNFYSIGREMGLDLPLSNLDNWSQQFTAVSSSGLNRSFIWLTTYGFAFADFRWFGIFYFLFSGCFIGIAYYYFRNRSLIGGIMYPYLLTTVIKWWSISYFSTRTTSIFVIVAVLIWFLSFILHASLLRKNESSSLIVSGTGQ